VLTWFKWTRDGKTSLRRPASVLLRQILKNRMEGHGTDFRGSGQEQVPDVCDSCNGKARNCL
jgi:hypothetical protein